MKENSEQAETSTSQLQFDLILSTKRKRSGVCKVMPGLTKFCVCVYVCVYACVLLIKLLMCLSSLFDMPLQVSPIAISSGLKGKSVSFKGCFCMFCVSLLLCCRFESV